MRCKKNKDTLIVTDVRKEKIVDYIYSEESKNTEENITKTIIPAEEYCKACYEKTGWTDTALIK